MTLPVSDNFNRTNANPAGGNWTPATTNVIQILSNRLVGVSGFGFSYWNADTPLGAQWASCKMPNSAARSGGPAVRIQVGTGTREGYRYNVNDGTLSKYVGGTGTVLQTITDTPSTTAVYKLEAIGSTIKVYKDGVQIGTDVTDTAWSSGSVGVWHSASSAEIDDWAADTAGTVVTAGNSAQANASDSGAIVQTNAVTAGGSTQANTSSSDAIVQTMLGEMLADNSVQVNQSTSGAVTQDTGVSAGNSTQANTSTSSAIAMTHVLSAVDSIQVNLSATGAIKQSQVIAAANSIQVNQSSSSRMLLTPGYWYGQAFLPDAWVDQPSGSTTWTPSPPTTSIWS